MQKKEFFSLSLIGREERDGGFCEVCGEETKQKYYGGGLSAFRCDSCLRLPLPEAVGVQHLGQIPPKKMAVLREIVDFGGIVFFRDAKIRQTDEDEIFYQFSYGEWGEVHSGSGWEPPKTEKWILLKKETICWCCPERANHSVETSSGLNVRLSEQEFRWLYWEMGTLTPPQ